MLNYNVLLLFILPAVSDFVSDFLESNYILSEIALDLEGGGCEKTEFTR